MGLFDKLKKSKKNDYDSHVELHLNAHFQPVHRFPLEDAIEQMITELHLGELEGGGTAQNPETGEIQSCDIQFCLKDTSDATIDKFSEIVESMGIPKGSYLQYDNQKRPVGMQEGFAIYLNGVDLPEEVYRSCDINVLIERLESQLDGMGRMYSFWEGKEWTVLYFYGNSSFREMIAKVQGIIDEYPLCEKCQVKQIA